MAMNPITFDANEVVLGAYRLPIKDGKIQVAKATSTAPKITIGETTRADQVFADEWVGSDWRAGLLVRDLDEQTQDGRFWWSTCDTMRKKKLMLPPLVVSLGHPNSESAPCDWIMEFGDYCYFSFGGRIYRWEGDTWSALLKDIGTIPTDSIVFKGDLYVAYVTGYSKLSGAVWSDSAENVKFFCAFDSSPNQKLIAIDADGLLKASADGTTWTTDVGGQITDTTVTGLVSFRGPNDEPILAIPTEDGLYTADIWLKTSYKTSLNILRSDNAGRRSVVWSDGNLYFPDGLSLWRYPRMGQITNVGLDRDDGLPADVRGKISYVAYTPQYLIATIDATTVQATGSEDLYLGAEWGTYTVPADIRAGFSAVFAWTGSGWHTLFLSALSSKGISCARLSTVYNNERRLFFPDDVDVKYMALPEGNYDPSLDPAALFAETGEHITGWFDSGYSEIDKLAVHLKCRTQYITTTETIDVYYALNNDETTWTSLGTINNTNIDSAGRVTFILNEPDGLNFSTIRLKFVLHRSGLTPGATPVLIFFDLRFARMPDTLWSWTFTVIDEDTNHLQNLWETMQSLMDAKKTYRFGFRAEEEEEKIVQIVSIVGNRYCSNEPLESFTLTVLELASA